MTKFLLGCGLAIGILAAHNATCAPILLPQPQSVQYGDGSLKMGGLTICHTSPDPAPEDTFAANQLATSIAQKTGVHLHVTTCGKTTHPSAAAITLMRTGEVGTLPVPSEHAGPDSREAYSLEVTAHSVLIRGRSSAAVFYGVQTLLQLLTGTDSNAKLPIVTIHDWPALAYRGTLVDVGSEGPMTTVEQIKKQLDLLARYKDNQYYFYSEGNIELDGYPLLNPDARFSKEEVNDVIAYARERHIDVVPAIELYGHLHDLFRIEKYSDLADFAHGGELNPNDPRVKMLVADWVAQLSDLFPSKFVDVGFDETWSLQKAAAQAGQNSTPVKLFVQQLTAVTQLFQARGKQVIAYADIMVKFPDIVPALPPGLIAMPWWYEAAPDPEYKKWLTPLVEHHVPHIVLSGVTSWDQVAPNFTMSFDNIDTFLAAGEKSGALGLVNSLWTDDGQMLMSASRPGFAYGAAAAWQSTPIDRGDFYTEYTQSTYGPAAAPHIAQAIMEIDAAEIQLESAVGEPTMLVFWQNPFAPALLKKIQNHRDALRQCRLHAEAAEEHLQRAIAAGESRDDLATYRLIARMLDYAGMKFIYAAEMSDAWATLPAHPTRQQLDDVLGKGISSETHSRTVDLMDGISAMKEPYRQAWLAEYTPYRLPTALGRWDAELEFWRHAQAQLNDLLESFHDGDALPPLNVLLK